MHDAVRKFPDTLQLQRHAPVPRREIALLATVTPLYALGHGIGMWRGAFELLRGAVAP